MRLVSENVNDLNFSTGQKPQIEINGSLYSRSPLDFSKLAAFQTEMIARSILRDNREVAAQLAKYGTTDLSYSNPRLRRQYLIHFWIWMSKNSCQ